MKKLIIPILIMFMSIGVYAQPGGHKMREKVRAQKVAFITQRLNLSVEEAQQFWPIYNAYEDKVANTRKNDLKGVRQAMRNGDLSEAEAQKILDQFMAVEDKLHEAKKQLVSDLKNVIPPQKIIQLKVTEEAFNKELLNKLREMRKQRGGMRN
ncbi:sensor of ECF-type sigma factor [Winogradskyella sp. 3972H.M.0a.05]|uniref:sensor of ECF-type sigma factor n=1 Tax=Winogradskyella sp. 3972H.M.0a.05 TaxID=2950277 RepID=UPI00339A2DE0